MKNKRVLVTGGTGSWGVELTKHLIGEGVKEIRVLARNEFLQFKMTEMFEKSKIKCIVGDIRDKECVKEAVKGVDIIFHLAALKHVPICEEQPIEAIKTNILGTSNVVEEAIKEGVLKVIYLSTDKVAMPCNTYGLTKAIGEKIVLNANTRSSKTKLSILRSGNILASSGSVIHIFKKSLEKSENIKLTHENMTRFYIGLESGVKRLIESSKILRGGEIFIMKMLSIKICDIAEILLEHYGKNKEYLRITGLRQGEKLNEVLVTKQESEYLYDLNKNFYAILFSNAKKNYEDTELKKGDIAKYSSDEEVVSKEEAKRILKLNNIIT